MNAEAFFKANSELHSRSAAEADLEFFRKKIMELAGIHMSVAKKDLIQTRLRSRLKEIGFSDFKEYREYLESLPLNHEEWQSFINQLTTNKTEWFRENSHFDYIVSQCVPQWVKAGKKKISVWSAASSTGEEPYTLAMVLKHALEGANIDFNIHATDLDTKVLAHGHNGVYKRSHLDQIPSEYHNTTFVMGTGDISGWMKVRSDLKKHVHFEQFNLMTEVYPWENQFDLIMCRNVLIYFPKQGIEHVIRELHRSAAPGGLLMIGHSESIQNIEQPWKALKPSIHRKG